MNHLDLWEKCELKPFRVQSSSGGNKGVVLNQNPGSDGGDLEEDYWPMMENQFDFLPQLVFLFEPSRMW